MEAIKTTNKLFTNPLQKLKFSVSVVSQSLGQIDLADPRSTRALVSLMDMNAVLGGAASHYGGPAAFAELMSVAHGLMFGFAKQKEKEWNDLFHFVNDAGHCENGLYALKANYGLAGLDINKLKKFRSMTSSLTGHGEVHLFPEGVFLSNGPLGSAFPQTLGLALGERLSGKMRTTICAISDGACMEGEAREAMASIPGLAAKGKTGPYILIISDNNTKLSGRIDQDSFSMKPTFDSLPVLGWEVLKLENGNDLQACWSSLEEAYLKVLKNPNKPVAIHAHTIKGIGTKKTVDSASGGHGFPLKSPTELNAFISEIYGNQKYPSEFDNWISELIELEKNIKAKAIKDSGEKIQKGVSSALIKAKKNGFPIISITSDLPGSTGVAEFRKEFPEASFDVGVAESNMISAAAGLSKLGFIPVVDTFAQFGVTKGALPITMASLSEAPIMAIFSHTGFQDAADGASHQALSYQAMLGSIPHVKIYNLSCSDEADFMISEAIINWNKQMQNGKIPDSVIFFLGRENFPKNYGTSAFSLEKSQIVFESNSSNKVCIFASGSTVYSSINAAEQLEKNGIGAVVINQSALNQFNLDQMRNFLNQSGGRVVIVEDHQKLGGLGQYLMAFWSQNQIPYKVKSLGVDGGFGQSAYSATDLYDKHNIGIEAIKAAVKQLHAEQ